MRFEKDTRTGETLKMNVIVYIAFIGVALGLAARNCFADPPKYLLAAACLGCGAYMGYCLVRFVRLLKTWEHACLEISGDRITGVSTDPGSCRSEPFEISLSEVEDASIREIKLTRRSPLPALAIRTGSKEYLVFGIQDMKTARGKLLPERDMY